jgi:hypothetical protein
LLLALVGSDLVGCSSGSDQNGHARSVDDPERTAGVGSLAATGSGTAGMGAGTMPGATVRNGSGGSLGTNSVAGSASVPRGTGGAAAAGKQGSAGANPSDAGGRAQAGGGGAAGLANSGGAGGQGAAGSQSSTDCGVSPVNPNATLQAKKLLCYLYSQFGNHVLSGQQETSWSNPGDDISYYVTNVGKYPAILGGDYLYPDGTSTRAIAYWNAGGITMIRYHMGNPPNADTYQNAMKSTNLDAVVTAGTAENTSFVAKLDYAATEIAKLRDANVALLWAPFHEVQPNGWIWWSKGTGPQYVALWKYMFDYFTNTKGLNNIIWLLPFSGSPNSSYYPGKAYVDIGGPDTYETNQPFGSIYMSARSVLGTTMPIALHETGTIPQPANMFPTTAPWLLFSVWAGYQTSDNTLTTIRSAYDSSYTVTRDELPNLK